MIGRISFIGLVFLSIAFPASVSAQIAEEPVSVSTAAHPKSPASGANVALVVRFELAWDFHLYRDKIRFDWSGLQGLEFSETILPDAQDISDPGAVEPGTKVKAYEKEATIRVLFKTTAKAGEPVRLTGSVRYQGCTSAVCMPPGQTAFDHDLGNAVEGTPPPEPSDSGTSAVVSPPSVTQSPVAKDIDLWFLFLKILQAFGIGFLISLTPCVYPMIGITAAIVGGGAADGKKRLGKSLLHSMAYVMGIAITYSLLGVVTALAGAPFAQFLKSPWVLVPISAVFVLLSLTMFDVLQIQTPGFIQRRLSGVGKGGSGLGSKFALGLVSGAVATPCVAAPLIATLIEIAAITGTHGMVPGIVYGLAMLFSLAWGMGVVLIVAGVLTANVLPRSGQWMVWIKKLFGFGMLWAAVYFALPVIGEGLYDLFTALLIFAGVVFLGGLDRLSAESGFFDRLKKALALPALVMAVLLFVGSVQDLTGRFPWLDCGKSPAYVAQEKSPLRLVSSQEFEEILKSGKPVVVDFWATWCEVCEKLDKTTFSDPRVREALSRFEAVKIDYDASPDLIRRFDVVGVPTVTFLDENGRERQDLRFSGDLSPEDFLAKLDALADR